MAALPHIVLPRAREVRELRCLRQHGAHRLGVGLQLATLGPLVAHGVGGLVRVGVRVRVRVVRTWV